MLSHFDTIPERDRQTDRQTDRIAISISCIIIAVLTHDKKNSNISNLGQVSVTHGWQDYIIWS